MFAVKGLQILYKYAQKRNIASLGASTVWRKRSTTLGLQSSNSKERLSTNVKSCGCCKISLSKTYATGNIEEEREPNLPVKSSLPRRFLPMTRRTLCRKLLEDESLYSFHEHVKFQDLVIGLDAAIARGFYGTLGEIKVWPRNLFYFA